MVVRVRHVYCLVLALMAMAPRYGAAQGYPGYPDTIMAPERAAARSVIARRRRRRRRPKSPTPAFWGAKSSSPNSIAAARCMPRTARPVRCCRHRCRRQNSFPRKAAARRSLMSCRRHKDLRSFPAWLIRYRTCRTVPNPFRIAPRAAASSPAFTTCRERRAVDISAAACSSRQRKPALILSSTAEPGHKSFSPSALSAVSTVLRWPCRSSASAST